MKPLLTVILLLLFQNLFAQNNEACTDSSYRKIFYSPADTIKTIEQTVTADQGNLLVGTYSPANSIAKEGLAFQLNNSGDLIWSKRYKSHDSNQWIVINRIIELQLGNFVLGGRLASSNPTDYFGKNIVLLKIDNNGIPVWKYTYTLNIPGDTIGEISLNSITEGVNGELLVACTVYAGQGDYFFVTRITATGAVVWSKAFVSPEPVARHTIKAFVQNNDIVVWGFDIDGTCSTDDARSIIALRLDYTTGIIKNTKRFCFADITTSGMAYTFYNNLYKAKKLITSTFCLVRLESKVLFNGIWW